MRIRDFLRNSDARETPDPAPADPSAPHDGEVPIPGYDKLDPAQLRLMLSQASQAQLAMIKTYELAHEARPVVLNRLHWLQESEPVPGYDALESEAAVAMLADADTGRLKAVREYERRHQNRGDVRRAIAHGLPTASVSPGETDAREQQQTLVEEGFASRAKTAAQGS